MKMDLEYPYNRDWKFGYLQVNTEGRNTVILFNSDKDRSSTSFARYLLSVKIGRYLTEDEEADHIDTDHSNDNIENLQILSVEEHKEKTKLEQSGQTYVEFFCGLCKKSFYKSATSITKTTKYCSVTCSRKVTLRVRTVDLSKELSSIIFAVENGVSDKELAQKYKVSQTKIFNFRKEFKILGPKQKIWKLLEENKLFIVSLRQQGRSFNYIANHFGLDKKVISKYFKKLQEIEIFNSLEDNKN